MSLARLGPDQNAYAQISEVCSPQPPPPSTPPRSGTGAKGLGKDLVLSSLPVLPLPGAYQPLTDLGKCSSGERAQGTPHSCAALAPMLGEMHRSTW